MTSAGAAARRSWPRTGTMLSSFTGSGAPYPVQLITTFCLSWVTRRRVELAHLNLPPAKRKSFKS